MTSPPPCSGFPESFLSIYSTFIADFKSIIKTLLPVIFCIAAAKKYFTKAVQGNYLLLWILRCACESRRSDPNKAADL